MNIILLAVCAIGYLLFFGILAGLTFQRRKVKRDALRVLAALAKEAQEGRYERKIHQIADVAGASVGYARLHRLVHCLAYWGFVDFRTADASVTVTDYGFTALERPVPLSELPLPW